MDLVSSGSRVVVTMEHVAKGGVHKILDSCSLPLTGKQVVNRIITDMCVLDVMPNGAGLKLVEIADNVSVDDVQASTGASFTVCENLKSMEE